MRAKRLPNKLRLGGTPLSRHRTDTIAPEPDGVRRINNKCIELETYSNFILGNSAGFIGITIVITALTMILAASVSDLNDPQIILAILVISPIAPCIACILYFANGAHRCRGTYIRIHRGTRKLYFIPPNDRKRLHIIDWDQIEAVAGYIPIVSTSGSASRHPLYLFGIDYTMNPPIEICAACGNLGLYDGDRSARSLWAYLQAFMAHGPEGLPTPPPLPPRLSRRDATLQPYRDWYASLCRQLHKPYGWLWAPITIPAWIIWLLINAYPDSVEAWLQYNVPYATFPAEIDVLCGFAEKRKPVIRVNGKRIEP
ncbi:hypothetical protein NJI34_33530 [Pseudomonas sp. S 311-6]|uniref:DUF6708 domain-containing protein n=1 Tax=Pseudomonas TaxID=286 RepID=UPI0020977755|nr:MULTISPECIES: DUF6708 domain-containing protein [Pseudomonas]MCO7641690.1 hypothetical protein [Pseudomonas sp. S 311-6]MCO7567125.1 hypothetical protein [Pseudomonas mosselii]MCO7596369.1 hypothetical protein [Pseudomonas guariconensis]MCO7618418.1 hypothetical protein [Pseudomonas guariconensis]MCU7219376.1 hypothetical protein [Pseudomonas brassicacearum]